MEHVNPMDAKELVEDALVLVPLIVEQVVVEIVLVHVVRDVEVVITDVVEHATQGAKMLVAVPHVQQPAEQHVLDLPDQQQETQINMEANKIYGDNK